MTVTKLIVSLEVLWFVGVIVAATYDVAGPRARYWMHPAGGLSDLLRKVRERAEPVPAPPTPVQVDPTALILGHRSMDADDSGAENWGDLLREMNTAEQVIYHEETFRLHHQLRGALDPHVDAFNARIDEILANWAVRTERISLGSTESPTGEFPFVLARPRHLVAA